MKLPSLRRDTQAALDKARQDLAAMATAIAELARRRETALAEADDDVGTVTALDREGHELGLRLRALQDRIAFLEHKIVDEQAEQAKKDFQVAVAAIAGPVARRSEAAVALEKALADVGTAAKRFASCTASVLEQWPDGVEFPSRAYPGHCLSLGRMGQLIESIFVGFEVSNPRTRRRVQATEFAARAIDAAEKVRLTAFAATERQLADEWLTDLKTAHDDPSPVESEDVENAA